VSTIIATSHLPVGQCCLIGAAQRADLAYDQEYIDLLAARISQHGLTHPIIVSADGRLLGGGDWLAAVRSLGWETVQVQVVGIFQTAVLR
jgi:ParB-like chromosome segregation protein Spo0J